jgi:hypothetical protein
MRCQNHVDDLFSAKGALVIGESATGRIRRGEPGAAPQGFEPPVRQR